MDRPTPNFETPPIRQSDELTLSARRLGGAARPAAQPRPGAEGRSRADFDPPAGRAISRLSRRGAGAEARDRRRLSRDGGVARLPQILPAAAQGRRRPIRAPRKSRCGCRCGSSGSTRCARPARGCSAATASGATCSCAARPKGCGWCARSAWQVRDFDLFAAYGAVRARTAPAMHVVHARSVMTLEEAIERVGADDRHGARLDLPRNLPAHDPGPAVPPLGAGVELSRRARARAPRPARHRSRTSRSLRSGSRAA